MQVAEACVPLGPSIRSKMKRSRQAQRELPPIGANLNSENTNIGDRRQLCEEIFKEGFVHSYVDFFYLTHRPDPNKIVYEDDEKRDIQSSLSRRDDEIQVSSIEMNFLREKLTTAEMSRRKGDGRGVYGAYCALAEYFQSRSADERTGIYFYEKCLEMARYTGDFRGELAANHDLGLAFCLLDENIIAINYFERQLEMAKNIDDEQEIRKALRQLMSVYQKAAAQQKEPIPFLHKAHDAARTAGDEIDEARTALALGEALLNEAPRTKKTSTEILSILQTAEQIYKRIGNSQGEGSACAILGQLWLHDEDDTQSNALHFLQRSLDIAINNDDLSAQAKASQGLAEYHSRHGNRNKAVTFLEQNFEISKQLLASGRADSTVLDKARVLLGVAIGKAKIEDYFQALTSPNNLSHLLAWKLARVPLPNYTTTNLENVGENKEEIAT
uniref:Tetratricopeptide repeat protein 29 n=1 Tax=Aureoumbra lagunensis TaxID=44058 RepID=A0A6S8CZB0_9STRA